MRKTVIGLAAAAAIITVGSTLSASACPYHEGYSGPRGEYGRGEYRPEFGRGEYRREFERREYPRREFGRGEYSERGSYGEYRD